MKKKKKENKSREAGPPKWLVRRWWPHPHPPNQSTTKFSCLVVAVAVFVAFVIVFAIAFGFRFAFAAKRLFVVTINMEIFH